MHPLDEVRRILRVSRAAASFFQVVRLPRRTWKGDPGVQAWILIDLGSKGVLAFLFHPQYIKPLVPEGLYILSDRCCIRA